MAEAKRTQGLRERKKSETRKAISEVAFRRITEGGYASVTVEDICAEVGISPRTFFNYYPSKIAAALDLADVTISEGDRAAFLDGTDSLVADACLLVARTMRIPADYRLLADIMAQRPEVGADLWEQVQRRKRPLQDLMAERTGDQHIADLVLGVVMVALRTAVAVSTGPIEPDELASLMQAELRIVTAHLS